MAQVKSNLFARCSSSYASRIYRIMKESLELPLCWLSEVMNDEESLIEMSKLREYGEFSVTW